MKKLLCIIFTLTILCTITGCSLFQTYEDTAFQTETESTRYNGYLGVAVTIPKEWWIYSMNSKNLGDTVESTKEEDTLQIQSNEELQFIELVHMANQQYSKEDTHIGFAINAEKRSGINSLAGYLSYYEEMMAKPYKDADPYELKESSQKEIQGIPFEKRVYAIPNRDKPYQLTTYICEVKNQYYLSIMIDHWTDNTDAGAVIETLLEDGLQFSL